MFGRRFFSIAAFVLVALGVSAVGALAQTSGGRTSATSPRPLGLQGSTNVKVLSHLTLGAKYSTGDIELEQDPDRPYAYVSRLRETGFDIIDLEDPDNAEIIYEWRIENSALHQGRGAVDGKYFKIDDRYYYLQSTQFGSGGPDSEVAGVVFDVTGLPDVSQVREVRRFRVPDSPGGFHNIFIYKHSDGRVILFATSSGTKLYDLGQFVSGADDQGLIGTIDVPANPGDLSTGYHDLYAMFDPSTQQDRFYGAGGGGYYVWDITRPDQPEIQFTITGVQGFNWGHTFTPTPDGRYAIGEAEWQYQPLRVFDLNAGNQAAARGELLNINRAIGVWTPDWETIAHNHEVRWPFVFVSGYETGLSVFNMMDPTNPHTVGYYDTFDGPHNAGSMGNPAGGGNFTWGVYDGAWGVDVRNHDGLVVISDMTTGFWAVKMDGFDGWNGNDWGMPNSSSVQDYDNGPDGVQRPIS